MRQTLTEASGGDTRHKEEEKQRERRRRRQGEVGGLGVRHRALLASHDPRLLLSNSSPVRSLKDPRKASDC